MGPTPLCMSQHWRDFHLHSFIGCSSFGTPKIKHACQAPCHVLTFPMARSQHCQHSVLCRFRTENVIVQQRVISLKQIWKMLPRDEMISRPWNIEQTKKMKDSFKIKTLSVARNLRRWNRFQVDKFHSKASRNRGNNPNSPATSFEQWKKPGFNFCNCNLCLPCPEITYNVLLREGTLPWEENDA